MKKIIFISLSLSMTSLLANNLTQRLWRELEQSKHKTQAEKTKEQDMAWLESIEQGEQLQGESVDQVMAEFNRPQQPKPSQYNSEDSISLKMAAPQRKSQRKQQRKPQIKQQNNPPTTFPLTRQRSR